jgi:hypothetical protein
MVDLFHEFQQRGFVVRMQCWRQHVMMAIVARRISPPTFCGFAMPADLTGCGKRLAGAVYDRTFFVESRK